MLVPLSSLWLPILIGAVLVFVVSSLMHMVLTHHKNDYRAVPREDEAMAAMRQFHLEPGDYCMPRAGSMAAMKSEEFKRKWAAGPVVFFTVMPSGANFMGATFVQWFLYSLAIGAVAAYVTGIAYGPGADYLQVFRMATTVAFAGFAGALPQFSIWYKRNWGTTIRSMADCLVYAMLIAGALGWLWPR